MRIQKVADLSGLSRGQINQLISRHGLGLHGGLLRNVPNEGEARDFTPADAFAFCIGGRIAALGCDMATIRDVIISLPIPAVDPATFRQLETFPGQYRADDMMLIVRRIDGEFSSVFERPDRVHIAVKKAWAAFVFPASQIANAVEAAGDD